MTVNPAKGITPALWRQLATICYDLLLVFGLILVATTIVVIPYIELVGPEFPADNVFFRLYLVAVIAGFFVWFWTHGGQTLGMRAWHVKLVRADGGDIRLQNALLRLLAATLSWAACGLGYLWILFDRESLSWHDHLSSTRLVMLMKPNRKP